MLIVGFSNVKANGVLVALLPSLASRGDLGIGHLLQILNANAAPIIGRFGGRCTRHCDGLCLQPGKQVANVSGPFHLSTGRRGVLHSGSLGWPRCDVSEWSRDVEPRSPSCSSHIGSAGRWNRSRTTVGARLHCWRRRTESGVRWRRRSLLRRCLSRHHSVHEPSKSGVALAHRAYGCLSKLLH